MYISEKKEKTNEGTDSNGNWAWGMLVLDRGNGGWLGLLSEHKNSSQISAESRDKHCHKDLSIFKKTKNDISQRTFL